MKIYRRSLLFSSLGLVCLHSMDKGRNSSKFTNKDKEIRDDPYDLWTNFFDNFTVRSVEIRFVCHLAMASGHHRADLFCIFLFFGATNTFFSERLSPCFCVL